MNESLQLPDVLENSCMAEQETVITFAREDDALSINTSDNVMWNKLKKLIQANPDVYKLVDVQYISGVGDTKVPCSVTVSAPTQALSLRACKKRELTDEQRAELQARMRELGKARRKHDGGKG